MRKLAIVAGCWAVLIVVGVVAGEVLLTDARLTAGLTGLLNRHLSGKFTLDRVHYGFPARVDIDNLGARSPSGAPVLAVGRVNVQARLLPLLLGRLVVEEVRVEDVRVDVIAAPGQQRSEFMAAFIPDFELPALRNIAIPIRLEVHALRLNNGDVMVQNGEGNRVRLRNMCIFDANARMQDDALHANLSWEALASARQKDTTLLEESKVEARVEDGRAQFAQAAFGAQAVTAALPGCQGNFGGDARLDRDGDVEADVHGEMAVDTAGLAPKLKNSDVVGKALHGHAALRFAGTHSGKKGEVTVALAQPNLKLRELPVTALALTLVRDHNNITLQQFSLGLGDGRLEAHGSLVAGNDPNIVVGEHSLMVKSHAMPVRELARPWVSLPALLPEAVSFAVTAHGRALWPPTTQVDVDIVPEGLPGENWPGLPHALELKGRFLVHPDLLEILKFEAYIDKLPDFGIQGAVPLREQGMFDLIEEIHSPHPKGPLRRMPVAPSDKKPN